MPEIRAEFVSKFKSNRLFFGLLWTLFLTEIIVVLTNVVALFGIGLQALGRIRSTDYELLGLSTLLGRLVWGIGSYMISLGNFEIIISVIIIYSIHGSHVKIVQDFPARRHHNYTQYWSIKSICSILMMGLSCTVFSQCILDILGVRLAIRCDWSTKPNSTLQQLDMLCLHEKNIFVMIFIMILAIAAYIHKRATRNGYQLVFYPFPKTFFDHILSYLWKYPMRPLRVYLYKFPIWILAYKLLIQARIYSGISLLPEFVALDGAMKSWTHCLELHLIFKSIVSSYLCLTVFRLQWFCVNYFLVQKPNASIGLIARHSGIVNLHYLRGFNSYLKTLGWFDLPTRTKDSSALCNLFTLDYPEDGLHIWRATVDEILCIGNLVMENFRSFVKIHMGAYIAATNNSQKTTPLVQGLTQHNSRQIISPNDSQSNMRQRHVIGRVLSSNIPPLSPVVPQPTPINIWAAILNWPILVFKSIVGSIKGRFFNVIAKIKQRDLWVYWTEPTFELDFNNLVADTVLMNWSLSVLVNEIHMAVLRMGSTDLVVQDIERFNKFFVEACEMLGILGRLVPKKMATLTNNGQMVDIDPKIKGVFKRQKHILMSEMTKYYHILSPYFENMSMDKIVLAQLKKYIGGSGCWGEDIQLT